MKARDIMKPLAGSLKPGDTVKHAVRMLLAAVDDGNRAYLKGLPVLDDKGVLTGMISMGDILKSVFPKYLEFMDLGDFTWDGMVEHIAEKAADRKISELMTEKVITVDEDAPLMECVDHMVKHNIKRLPVVDKNGRPCGMIYEIDVFVAITKAMHIDQGGAK